MLKKPTKDPSATPNPGDGEGGDGDANGAGDGGGLSDDVRGAISKIANAAQSSHATRMNKHFDKRFSEIQESITTSVGEQITALQVALAGKVPPKKDDKGSKDDKGAIDQLNAKYAKQITALQDKVAAADKRTADADTLRSRNEERSVLTEALRAGGVDGPLLKSAMALLFTEEKRVSRDADGGIVFKSTKDGLEEELDVKAGVKEWLATDDGKHFSPARAVAGSGNKGGKVGTQKGKRTKMDAMKELQEHLFSLGS